MTTAVIVQARMTSSRLPGKVMAPVMGRPLLAYLLERVKRSKADLIVVATTQNDADDPITELAQSMGAQVIWGPEQDVMQRFLMAADALPEVDTIVRVTADCPLIDPATVDSIIDRFEQGDAHHVEVWGLPDGMGCEAISVDLLRKTYSRARPDEREHVTLYVRRRGQPLGPFRLVHVETGLDLDKERWTVDVPADLAFVTAVIEALYPTKPEFTLGDIVDLLIRRPELRAINAHVPMGPLDVQLLSARPKIIDATIDAAGLFASIKREAMRQGISVGARDDPLRGDL